MGLRVLGFTRLKLAQNYLTLYVLTTCIFLLKNFLRFGQIIADLATRHSIFFISLLVGFWHLKPLFVLWLKGENFKMKFLFFMFKTFSWQSNFTLVNGNHCKIAICCWALFKKTMTRNLFHHSKVSFSLFIHLYFEKFS